MATLSLYTSSELSFDQSMTNWPTGCSASSQLSFTDTLHLNNPHIRVEQPMAEIPLEVIVAAGTDDPDALAALFEQYGLRQEVSVRRSIINISVKQTFSLTQDAGQGPHMIVGQSLGFTDSAKICKEGLATGYLALAQSVDVIAATGAYTTLSITDEAVAEKVSIRTNTSALVISSDVTYWLFQGENATCPVPFTHRTTTRLYCNDARLYQPIELELPNPDFGNTEQFEFTRVNRRSRGGALQMYSKTTWPKSHRLVYTFSSLSETQKKSLLDFMEKTLGYQIQITDCESRVWNGIITTPTADAQQPGVLTNSVSVQFEGELA